MLHFSIVLVLYIFCVGYNMINPKECDTRNAYDQNQFFNTYVCKLHTRVIIIDRQQTTFREKSWSVPLSFTQNDVSYHYYTLSCYFNYLFIRLLLFVYITGNINRDYPTSSRKTVPINNFNIFRFRRLFI